MRFGAQKNRLIELLFREHTSYVLFEKSGKNILVTLYKLYKGLILKHVKGQYLNI